MARLPLLIAASVATTAFSAAQKCALRRNKSRHSRQPAPPPPPTRAVTNSVAGGSTFLVFTDTSRGHALTRDSTGYLQQHEPSGRTTLEALRLFWSAPNLASCGATTYRLEASVTAQRHNSHTSQTRMLALHKLARRRRPHSPAARKTGPQPSYAQQFVCAPTPVDAQKHTAPRTPVSPGCNPLLPRAGTGRGTPKWTLRTKRPQAWRKRHQ